MTASPGQNGVSTESTQVGITRPTARWAQLSGVEQSRLVVLQRAIDKVWKDRLTFESVLLQAVGHDFQAWGDALERIAASRASRKTPEAVMFMAATSREVAADYRISSQTHSEQSLIDQDGCGVFPTVSLDEDKGGEGLPVGITESASIARYVQDQIGMYEEAIQLLERIDVRTFPPGWDESIARPIPTIRTNPVVHAAASVLCMHVAEVERAIAEFLDLGNPDGVGRRVIDDVRQLKESGDLESCRSDQLAAVSLFLDGVIPERPGTLVPTSELAAPLIGR